MRCSKEVDDIVPNDTDSPAALLADRYGKAPRKSSPLRRWGLTVLGVLFGIGAAWVAYQNLGATPIEGKVVNFNPKDDHAVELTFSVTRDEPGRAAVCIVRSRDGNGDETGRKEVYIRPNDASYSTVIRTSKRPNTAEIYGCSYQVPEYLSSAERPSG
ncbi:DUF4307 domain-containing protein [Pseudonocardiaceae bacterium YIM PH 21723]|nr:DUF4307 domain-containing protein [Pseudonocardiaceae bacterium YIM PH 21723]